MYRKSPIKKKRRKKKVYRSRAKRFSFIVFEAAQKKKIFSAVHKKNFRLSQYQQCIMSLLHVRCLIGVLYLGRFVTKTIQNGIAINESDKH